MRSRMGGVDERRIQLLRILSSLDQSMAKVDEIMDDGDTSQEEFQRAADAVAELRDFELRTHAALRLLGK